MKSIRWKIVFAFSLIIILSVVSGVAFSNYMLNQTANFSLELVEKELQNKEVMVQNVVNSKVSDIKKSSIMLAEQIALNNGVIEGIKQNNPDMIHDALKETSQVAMEKANIDLIWVTSLADRTPDGRTPILACPTNPDFDGFDGLNYGSTNEALDSGETVISWEVNEEDGKLQVTVPVYDGNQIIGGVVVGQQTYQLMIKDIAKASGTSGTLFLKDGDDFYVMTDSQSDEIGEMFFNQSHEKLGMEKAKTVAQLVKDENNSDMYTSLEPLLQRSAGGGESFTETVELHGKPYVLNFKPLTTYQGTSVGTLVSRFPGLIASKNEILNQSQSTQRFFYIISGLIIVLSLLISYLVSRQLTTPLMLLKEQMTKISQGHLNSSVTGSVLKRKDEFGLLANGFNSMVSSLNGMVGKVKHSSDALSASSNDFSAIVQQNSAAVEEITYSVNQLAASAQDNEQAARQGSEAVKQVSAGAENVASHAERLTGIVQDNVKAAQDGAAMMQETSTAIDETSQTAGEIDDKMERLEQVAQDIGSFVQSIISIAEQTNLLALNAAIEAARAGEAGKGFAVVAEEIRKLAEESNQSAGKITDLIGAVQNTVGETSQVFHKAYEKIEEVVQKTGKTIASIETIVSQSENALVSVEEIASVSEEQAASSEELNSIIDDLLQAINQTTDASQQISASTEEQTASHQQMNSMAQELNKMSDELKNIISQFTDEG